MKRISLFIILLSLTVLLRLYFHFLLSNQYKVGDKYSKQITLLSDTKISGNFQTFKDGRLTIQTYAQPVFSYGDTLKITGTVSEKSFLSDQNKKVSYLQVSFPQIEKAESKSLLVKTAAFIRNRVETSFFSTLPHNEAALLFGIVFGGSSAFDPEFYNAFRKTGVLHVVAASGMNVTMFASFILILSGLFLKRQKALAVSIIGILYYALISGLQPSILRAAIMSSIAFSAGIFGRQSFGFLTLFFTACIMVFLRPDNLFDVGFLLSVSSTCGILYIKPLFDRVKFIKKTEAVSSDITTSISSQLASLPILALFFSAYSAVSILVNALVLWTIPILMVLGGIAALLAVVFPLFSNIFLYLCFPFLLYFEKIVFLFQSIPLIEFQNTPLVIWLGSYSILIAIVLKLRKPS